MGSLEEKIHEGIYKQIIFSKHAHCKDQDEAATWILAREKALSTFMSRENFGALVAKVLRYKFILY
jgi:hypothetical protein